jgi:DNA-binding GntR family transcriptional regulator
MATTQKTLKSSSLARHRVRREIERMIMAGQRQAGDALRQQDLSDALGVAQSVVREALLELQFTGLVRRVEHVGVFVSEIDIDTLLAAYEVREMFEGLAARRCCQHASRADLAKLRKIANDVYAHGERGDAARMGAIDRLFHETTLRIARNDMIIRLTESYRLLGMAVRAHRDYKLVRDEHLSIVDAIQRDEPDEAEQLARRHVRAARQSIIDMIEREGFEPKWIVDDPPTDMTDMETST